MNISRKELTESIKSLLKDQDLDEVMELLLGELTEVQLQDVIQIILDPEYKSKQGALTDPKRFMVKGELDQVKKNSVDVKVTANV